MVTVLLEYLDLAHIFRLHNSFRFFYTAARIFFDEYSSYTPIFISMLLVIYLVHMKTKRFLFTKNDHVILTQVGFASYLQGIFLDSFQTMKRHSYDSYSIYVKFNSFLEVVYPVGVTTNRSCFMQTIGEIFIGFALK